MEVILRSLAPNAMRSVDCVLSDVSLHEKCAVATSLSDMDGEYPAAAAEICSFPYVLIQLSADSHFTAQRMK